MFVDTFTVQYLQNLRDARKDDKDEPRQRSRITPIVSIFAGIILLICSVALIAAKSGDIPDLPKIPHVDMPKMPKVPHVDLPKMPEMPEMPEMPKIKMPDMKFPQVKLPKIFLEGEAAVHDPRSPVVAGNYQIKKLYDVKGVSCEDGQSVMLWQDVSENGDTVFGSNHGSNVVGTVLGDGMWNKGGTFFALATYNGNQRGIVQINEKTNMVENINPGDGCLFTSQCAHLGGTWERQARSACKKPAGEQMKVEQDGCDVSFGASGRGYVRENALYSTEHTTGKKVLQVVSNHGILEAHDSEGCVYRRMKTGARED